MMLRLAFCELPGGSQAHLLSGELLGSFWTIAHLVLRLQVHIQTHAQTLNLIGQKLEAWTWPLQLCAEDVYLTLNCLQTNESASVLEYVNIWRVLDRGALTRRLSSVRPLPSPFHWREREKRGVTSGYRGFSARAARRRADGDRITFKEHLWDVYIQHRLHNQTLISHFLSKWVHLS